MMMMFAGKTKSKNRALCFADCPMYDDSVISAFLFFSTGNSRSSRLFGGGGRKGNSKESNRRQDGENDKKRDRGEYR